MTSKPVALLLADLPGSRRPIRFPSRCGQPVLDPVQDAQNHSGLPERFRSIEGARALA
jgi:hypothetical protein